MRIIALSNYQRAKDSFNGHDVERISMADIQQPNSKRAMPTCIYLNRTPLF